MVSSSRIVSVLLFSSVAWGVTIQNWKNLPQQGITQNTDGNFTYNNTNAQTGNFILSDNIFFQNSELKKMEFGGRLRRYEDINYLLEKMEETQDVQFIINGNTITIKRKTD